VRRSDGPEGTVGEARGPPQPGTPGLSRTGPLSVVPLSWGDFFLFFLPLTFAVPLAVDPCRFSGRGVSFRGGSGGRRPVAGSRLRHGVGGLSVAVLSVPLAFLFVSLPGPRIWRLGFVGRAAERWSRGKCRWQAVSVVGHRREGGVAGRSPADCGEAGPRGAASGFARRASGSPEPEAGAGPPRGRAGRSRRLAPRVARGERGMEPTGGCNQLHRGAW